MRAVTISWGTALFLFFACLYTIDMPEQESIQTLEEEIRVLEEKLATRKVTEAAGEHASPREEKDVFRDVLREHVESAKEQGERRVPSKLGDFADSSTSSPPFDYALQSKQKADDMREKEHHEQVEALVEIALTKGILEAVHVARHLDNPHLLDDFHDMLVDEYYEKLVQARKIS